MMSTTEIQREINLLQQSLLVPGPLEAKLKLITDSVVRIFNADFCRIWLIRPGDLCDHGCIHAEVRNEMHVCHFRDKCLHLMASSGRYTHIDGKGHRRVPFGCYKIGLVASGQEHKFLTNDVQHEPRVHNHQWATELGLVSFAGYQLRVPGGQTMGVLALFAQHEITSEEDTLLDSVSCTVAHVVKQAEIMDALYESEERYRNLFENSRDALMTVIPPFWNFTSANSATASMFGARNLEEMLSCNPLLLSPEYQPDGRLSSEKGREMINLALREGSNLFEWKHKRLNGEEFFATVLLTRAELRGQKFLQATVRDITQQKLAEEKLRQITEKEAIEKERRRLEEQLQETQKLESLGLLAGGIAHDFNNLLTGILGYSTLAIESLSGNNPVRKNIEEIEKSAYRAADLTHQLLAYSGKGQFVIEPINLSAVVEDMAGLLEISISKKCSLIFDFTPELPVLDADITQIRQVVMNLILNASEAIGDKNGTIKITTSVRDCDQKYLSESYLGQEIEPGQYVSLEVSDTGVGMTEEVKARLFDPFFTTKFTGRGLGLAAVLGIVRGHKGAIMVYSEPDKGTTFRILFPIGKTAPQSKTTENASIEQKRGYGLILVVDDEEAIRMITKNILEASGYTVLTASNGSEALKVFRENADSIQLVLLDMTMPLMDGKETFCELRKIRHDIKVLLSSGYNEQDTINQFTYKGLAGFIPKPFTKKSLLDAVAKVMEVENAQKLGSGE